MYLLCIKKQNKKETGWQWDEQENKYIITTLIYYLSYVSLFSLLLELRTIILISKYTEKSKKFEIKLSIQSSN